MPIESLAPAWRTVPVERLVLAVVHNVTAATRLLDVLPLWTDDTRVQTVFTCVGSSAFTSGTVEWLTGQGMTVLDWADAVGAEFDLAIAASHGGPLHELRAPLIVLPHGMGYNKLLADHVFGLSPPWLLHEGELIPSVLVLSHSEQLDRLRAACPEATGIAVVAGDPTYDRILAGAPLRATYREALGAAHDQRLVLVSSTWGERSLFGRDPGLVLRLATELPLDEYRIVVALHPNIWFGHSPWQLRRWLAACSAAGVTVLPPVRGWQAAVAAADLTIGDHSSVSFYSAATGTPVLLASAPHDTLDPASPIAALLRAAPLLDPAAPLRPQLDAAAYRHDTDLATSVPGEAAALIRTLVYKEIGLTEPETPAVTLAAAPPVVDSALPAHQLVGVGADGTVRRFPAEALRSGGVPETVLVVSTDEPSREWLQAADSVVHSGPLADPGAWMGATLRSLPGCRYAAAKQEPGRWLVGDRAGRIVRVHGPDDLGHVYAAFQHFGPTTRFTLGGRTVTCSVEETPGLLGE
ncbi:hypothetical protein [Amycolatopsis suaedae]|uniref:Uncharacterized protein n=1 Tax=Amycolatopsis suaedae TaxID=2510978 RepID=A0A4Q7JBI4_9PSEU|nr:hypothetical protein [Amycolatopsis suaedae]RZQ64352.1 hypothetical protein EWH70_10305 [Amycolatopsis suaedae]